MFKRVFWSAYLGYHLRGQAGFPFKSMQEIDRVTNRSVRSIAAYAFQHVPYYRETMKRLGLTPGDFAKADDLAKLPIVEKEQLRSDPEYFTSREQTLDRYLVLTTSGTSGPSTLVYHDLGGLLQNAAHGERERTIIAAIVGKRYGYRETLIGWQKNSQTEQVQRFCQSHALYPRGARIVRQYLDMFTPIAQNIQALNEFKPEVIECLGSYLGVLFRNLQRTGTSLHPPKLITYGADAASPSVRKLISNSYQIPVLSTYGSIEMLKIAFECEQHAGLHLNCDLYPIRLVDDEGRTVPDGEDGQLIISNLVNRATVLLNYRLGDVNRFIPERCACGRTLPLLAFPEGRLNYWVELPGGRLHPSIEFREIFTVETQILQYQVIQQAPASFQVSIVATGEADSTSMTCRIVDRFAQAFGSDLAIDVRFVDSVEMTAGGKIVPVLPLWHRDRSTPPVPTD